MWVLLGGGRGVKRGLGGGAHGNISEAMKANEQRSECDTLLDLFVSKKPLAGHPLHRQGQGPDTGGCRGHGLSAVIHRLPRGHPKHVQHATRR